MKTIAQLMRCDGRVVLIVGGAGHLGYAAAEAYAEMGAKIAIADIDIAGAHRAVERLKQHSPQTEAWALEVDLASEASARAAAERTHERFGQLDALIHSAAFVGTTAFPGWAVPFSEQTATAFEAACRINLTSAFVLAQSAAPYLTTNNGSIILVSSIYGSVAPAPQIYVGTAMQNPLGYGASKAALQQLARSLATTLAPHVRVNTVSPGGVLRGQPDSFVSRYVERTPLGRMANEEDLKGAFAYLVSDLSSYVTGHDLVVDGGWTAW